MSEKKKQFNSRKSISVKYDVYKIKWDNNIVLSVDSEKSEIEQL